MAVHNVIDPTHNPIDQIALHIDGPRIVSSAAMTDLLLQVPDHNGINKSPLLAVFDDPIISHL